ncbi:MAG: PSD1 domain-containing protein [Planctomycetaceae bacterium]|nr:PSD1 domain-containing protein [Planctomycetaceae bacterium]
MSRFLFALMVSVMFAGSAGGEESFFQAQVEPILRRRCYDCHSHAQSVMEGGLTLDWRSGWAEGGERGPAVVPGDPANSLLIRAVRHAGDLKMPEEKLPAGEIEILERWVRDGADDPRVTLPESAAVDDDWWSLQTLTRPAVPQNESPHPIDAFVSQRLAKSELTLAEPADRTTLIRRLTFDLHGLHPSPDDVTEFVTDNDPAAVEKLIDRLLSSPRYGERQARHWLDVIHFADSHGFEHDVFRPNAWRFRDYVISALNDDTPWSVFIREQLAADHCFPESSERRVALGFLGAGTYDQSAAATAPMSFENLDRDDLVTQVMGTFTSTTVGCARCHAHKFDPVSQQDYYSLQAVFAGIGKGDIAYDDDPAIAEQRRRWQSLQAAAIAGDSDILLDSDQQKLVAEWESRGGAAWRTLQLSTFHSASGAALTRQTDGSVLSAGTRPDTDTVILTCAAPNHVVTALRLDVLADESLPMGGPGRQENGNLHLTEFELLLFGREATEPQRLKIQRARADFDQAGWTIQHALDGDMKTAWGIYPEVGRSHHAVFELQEPLNAEPGAQLSIVLKQLHGAGHLIGRVRCAVTNAAPDSAIALSDDAESSLQTAPESRTTEQRLILAAEILRHRSETELSKLPAPVEVYAAGASAKNERGLITISQPREIRVLRRGDPEKPGEIVAPGTLHAVKGLPSRFLVPEDAPESARRAALADWLVHPNNPLTWRSIVNRIWQQHFGRGLVDTPNDFGRMGSLPTHPELLDWLACEFRDSGGSQKHLHRLICTSAVYQQTSVPSEAAVQRDGENRLLSRMVRRRMDAETFRDSVLVLSGQLNLTMGGPGDKLFSESPGPQATPVLDYDAVDLNSSAAVRRSIYRVVWRGIPDPFFEALDFPDLGLPAPTRGFSASPLQSLVLLNHRFILHHSDLMARQAQRESSDLSQLINDVVRQVWLRQPDAEEHTRLRQLAEDHGPAAVCRLLINSN